MPETPQPDSTRHAILAELDSLTAIARGTLSEEFREKPSPDGEGTVRLGPYFKHQFWDKGRNQSARVPAQCADQLRIDLQNGKRFDELTAQLAALAMEEGASRRAALASQPKSEISQSSLNAKKNSTKNASKNATKKPKPSSPPSSRGSRSKV